MLHNIYSLCQLSKIHVSGGSIVMQVNFTEQGVYLKSEGTTEMCTGQADLEEAMLKFPLVSVG